MKILPIKETISKKQADLTMEELRAFPGLTALTDEQATNLLVSLKELSILLFYSYTRQTHSNKQVPVCTMALKQAA